MKQRASGAWVGPATQPWVPLSTLEADYATESEANAAYAPLTGTKLVSATGVAISGVTTTETVFATLSVPSQGRAYEVVPTAEVFLAFSAVAVNTHTWRMRLREDSVSGTIIVEKLLDAASSVGFSIAGTKAVAVAGGGAKTIVATLQRTVGSNNVSTFADGVSNRIAGMVYPT